MNATGRTISTSLAADQHAASEARALVDTLPRTITPAERDDLRLALSELVVSSVLEGTAQVDRRIDVQLTLHSGGIRCEVADDCPRSNTERRRERAPGTGGLVLVDRIATRWGTLRHGRGVWFEVDLDAGRTP